MNGWWMHEGPNHCKWFGYRAGLTAYERDRIELGERIAWRLHIDRREYDGTVAW